MAVGISENPLPSNVWALPPSWSAETKGRTPATVATATTRSVIAAVAFTPRSLGPRRNALPPLCAASASYISCEGPVDVTPIMSS